MCFFTGFSSVYAGLWNSALDPIYLYMKMKRTFGTDSQNPRRSSARKSAGVLLVGSLVLGAFSSCNLFTYTRPFADEYYDSNYIASIGFDKFVGADTAVPSSSSPVTGSWDFTYRYESWGSIPVYDAGKGGRRRVRNGGR